MSDLKILFLDIDGVMNHGPYDPTSNIQIPAEKSYGFLPSSINSIQRIVQNTESKIILTSTWRDWLGPEQFMLALGLPPTCALPSTPFLNDRDKEVLSSLAEHKPKAFAIIDDCPELFYSAMLKECLITTTRPFGVCTIHANVAISTLNFESTTIII